MFFKKDIEIEELQYRILILEKRLEEYRREDKKARKELDATLTEKINELIETKANKRIRKTKWMRKKYINLMNIY